MSNHYTFTEADIEVAQSALWHIRPYPPIREHMTVQLETHPSYGYEGKLVPFVNLAALPERFHWAIHKLSYGCQCPYFEGIDHAYYVHDMERWLYALGVEPRLIAP